MAWIETTPGTPPARPLTSTSLPSRTVLPTSVSVPPLPATPSAGRSETGLAIVIDVSETMVSDRAAAPQPLLLLGGAKQDWMVALGPM